MVTWSDIATTWSELEDEWSLLGGVVIIRPPTEIEWTEADIDNALRSSGRYVTYRYELLDQNNVHIDWLDGWVSNASIEHSSFADIQRTAQFQILHNRDINYLTSRIRPWMRLRMRDGQWFEWPFGMFLLSTPKHTHGAGEIETVQAYDQLLVLHEDIPDTRFTVQQGTNVIEAARQILLDLGFGETVSISIPASDVTMQSTRDWDIGSSRLAIVNALLNYANYTPLSFNGRGDAFSNPYRRPDEMPTAHTYSTKDRSLIIPGATHELDLFGIPNQWIAIVSEPEEPPMVSSYTNDNPESPTSTVNLNRVSTDIRENVEVGSQAALDAYVERIAFEASQVYERVEFETPIMPKHETREIVRLRHDFLNVSARFTETDWSADLYIGGSMKHKLRRVVAV